MRKNIICGIYCIENIINNKKYIGQSVNAFGRWCHHKNELNKNIHCNDYLQKSWNKYGEENFKFYILEECEPDLLNDKERYYIQKYNTLDRGLGYNLKDGGQDTNFQTDECKEKLREAVKKSYENNPDLRKLRSETALKQWSNPEIKAKISGKNNPRYGKHLSEEARKKISDVQKGHIAQNRDLNPVICIELNKEYSCAAEAAKDLNDVGCSGSILEICRGSNPHRHTTHGYHWKFKTENNIC